MGTPDITIRPVREEDLELVLEFIRELAEYERLAHEVTATAQDIRAALFGARPYAEAVIGCLDGEACGFALFFHNFSTFLGRPGLYLEDLYAVSYTHLRAHETGRNLVCRLL